MNILILEEYGAIGNCLAKRFVKEGHNVHILGNICGEEKKVNDIKIHDIKIGDIEFKDLVEKERFDIIIDSAKIHTDKKAFNINVKEVETLLKLSNEYNVKKIILLSTTDIYMEENIIDEKSRIIPRTAYGISMLAYEEYYNIYKEIYSVDLGILRISNIYGSSLKYSDEYIKDIVERFLGNKDLNGEFLRNCKDYICVKDVVNGVYKAVFKEGNFIYNLSYGKSYSGEDILDILKLIRYKHKYSRAINEERFVVSNKLAEKELGWYPIINLEEGIYFLINSLKHKDIVVNKKNRNFIIFVLTNLVLFLGIYLFSNTLNIEYDIHIQSLVMFLLVLMASILGLKEGIVTCGLSSGVLIANAVSEYELNGQLSSICLEGLLVSVLIYIVTSLTIGSIIDKNKREFNRVENKYNNLYNKLNFVYRLYKDE